MLSSTSCLNPFYLSDLPVCSNLFNYIIDLTFIVSYNIVYSGGPKSFIHVLLNIIRQVTSRRMRWAGQVACIGEEKKCIRFWWESPKERGHSENQGLDGRMDQNRSSGEWLGVRLNSTGSE
jgi:hypothetical protein